MPRIYRYNEAYRKKRTHSESVYLYVNSRDRVKQNDVKLKKVIIMSIT